MNTSRLEWYLRRLEKMSASEVAWRLSDYGRKLAWARHQVARVPGANGASTTACSTQGRRTGRRPSGWSGSTPSSTAGRPRGRRDRAAPECIAAGDQILAGRSRSWASCARTWRTPDWFFDPVTGRRAPQADYCFRIDHRSEDVTGNVKQVWELSRMHHLTVLAAAFAFSGDERYAERSGTPSPLVVGPEPVLVGGPLDVRDRGRAAAHRLGVDPEAARRLGRAPALFEHNEEALAQIWWHQRYLAGFRSRGSSANNHVIAEAAGQLVAALAFDWFAESPRWAARPPVL